MWRSPFLFTVAALMVGSERLPAQTPNFAGTWTRIVDPNAPARGAAGLPDGLTIAQDSKTLTIVVHPMGSRDVRSVFNLDGTDSEQTITEGDGTPSDYVSRAKWDGSRLVVTRVRKRNGTSSTATFAYSLDATGHLVVVVRLPPPSTGADPVTLTASFQKS